MQRSYECTSPETRSISRLRSKCLQLPFYVAAQLAGSVLACLSVNAVMRPREEHFYGTAPMAGHSTRLPFLMELLASAVLMIVIATAARGSVRAYRRCSQPITDDI